MLGEATLYQLEPCFYWNSCERAIFLVNLFLYAIFHCKDGRPKLMMTSKGFLFNFDVFRF